MEQHELIQQMRGMLQRGVVGSVDDTGDVQTAVLNTGDDVTRSLVEVHQAYGLASLPPDEQPLALVLSVGGDQGHQVALHLWSAYRFGKLAPGEVALYDAGGNRLHLKAGGNVDLLAAALLKLASLTMTLTAQQTMALSAQGDMSLATQADMTVSAQGAMTITAAGITITGPVTFASPVTFEGPVIFEQSVTIGGNLTVRGVVTGIGATRGAL